MENKVDSIIVTHKDRFICFGYDWFERFLSKYNSCKQRIAFTVR